MELDGIPPGLQPIHRSQPPENVVMIFYTGCYMSMESLKYIYEWDRNNCTLHCCTEDSVISNQYLRFCAIIRGWPTETFKIY